MPEQSNWANFNAGIWRHLENLKHQHGEHAFEVPKKCKIHRTSLPMVTQGMRTNASADIKMKGKTP